MPFRHAFTPLFRLLPLLTLRFDIDYFATLIIFIISIDVYAADYFQLMPRHAADAAATPLRQLMPPVSAIDD
jgi:hypothetical protein